MLLRCMLPICALFAFLGVCQSFEFQFDIPEDWVDPTDMATFDYGTKTNRKSEDFSDQNKNMHQQDHYENGEKTHSAMDDESGKETLAGELEPVEKKTKPPDSTDVQDPEKSSCQKPFLRRFVAVLQKQLERVGSPPLTRDFEMAVHLDSRNWLILQEFVEECKGAPEATRVLEQMVTNVRIQINEGRNWKKSFEDFIHVPFQDFMKLGVGLLLIVTILTLERLSHVSWSSQIKRLFILAFIVSFGMTYIHEMQLAEAEYRSKSTDIPPQCLGNKEDDTSYWQSIKSVYNDMFSVKEDPCLKYHEDHIISPLIKVTPTKVIAVTLTRFVVEPMEHIGTAFSKAFKNIFAGLPITLWIPAFLFVVLVILGFLLIVAVCFGYNFSFNLPFWAGLQMGPQQTIQHNPEMDRVLEDNRRHIDQLHATIRDLRDRPQQQALPAPTVSPTRAILGYFGLGRSNDGNPPQEPPNPPPPYPASQPHGSNLPYPDFDAPHYPPENRGYGNEPHERYGPATTGLRRRNTVPRARERKAYEAGDPQLPYPAENLQPRTSPTSRVPPSDPLPQNQILIGFEHLVEQNEEEDPASKTIPCQDEMANIQDIPSQRNPTVVVRPVEEIPQKASGDAGTTNPKVMKDTEPKTSSGERNEVSTLPAEEVGRIENSDSPDPNLEGWEEVSAEDGKCEEKECAGEKLNTMELQAIFEREAQQGFESHDCET